MGAIGWYLGLDGADGRSGRSGYRMLPDALRTLFPCPWFFQVTVPAPSKRSLLEAFVDLQVAGGDLLEGPGT